MWMCVILSTFMCVRSFYSEKLKMEVFAENQHLRCISLFISNIAVRIISVIIFTEPMISLYG